MTKKELIQAILEDIRENEYDSKELLYYLAEQGLKNITYKELQETYLTGEF